ncbi:alpha/beta fold hydrolase [Quadrisphaera oryzae]|uniref:alpha/beta fold hydrolase n=1 Tax=Quadrisphaera TaxID=317661 RepID=UPI00164740EB|nr:alpha/beta hydrolase [Quadrisphaera sp. RL12-1S]MBC3761825.1 alpha/beta fold hydrolase [Quadrisphaera sp. RL12-1S]
MPVVRIDKADIAFEEAGEGAAIVFSHAGIAYRRMWDGPFTALAADHRVIRYDWRGYGDSDPARGDYAHHEDLLGLLDALGVQDGVLVGCSMGGGYALQAALEAPERVAGLVLISSGVLGHAWPHEWQQQVREELLAAVPETRLRAYAAGTATQILSEDIHAMAEVQARIMVAGPRRTAADVDAVVWDQALVMLERIFEREWSEHPVPERVPALLASDRLVEISAPTLVINGLEDVPAIQAVSDLLSEGIPGAQRLDLADTGHLPPLERPQQVTRAIQDFLAEPANVPASP